MIAERPADAWPPAELVAARERLTAERIASGQEASRIAPKVLFVDPPSEVCIPLGWRRS